MKNKYSTTILTSGLAWLAFLTFSAQLSIAWAQGTAFTYQGRLNDGANPAIGTYDITLTLFNAATGGAVVGPSNVVSALVVSNGLFTVAPDFGPQFNGLDRWVEIAVRTNGSSAFTPLSPRQKLTPTPYALFAPQAGTATTAFGVTPDAVGVSGLQSSSVNSAKIADGSINAVDVDSASFSNTFWKVNGNAGANPTNGAFLGTTDNLPVEIRVNGARALRLEPNTNGAPNVIGGSPSNSVAASVEGATIAGGGLGLFPNKVTASYATIGGGRDNSVAGGHSTVSGGNLNMIQTNADFATIGGGSGNTIQTNASFSTIGGGWFNRAAVNEATVAGGAFNNALGFSATVGGGGNNAASGEWSTVAGGRDNVLTNADYAAIGGGLQNIIQTNAAFSTIGGGGVNVVRSNASRGTVGGGFVNTVGAPEGTVAGGAFNSALGFSATIGGGGNNAASGAWSTIAGGRDNLLTNAPYATIGGGVQNTIQTNADYATIGGGGGNMIQSNAHFATIPGGRYNSATNYAFAAGNRAKANHAGAFVWADTTDSDFTSTAPNQFVIRASGGVGINNNNTGGAALAVNGDVNVEGIISANALSAASATTPSIITPRIATGGNVPLELFVNGQRGLRLEPTATPGTVNVIAGAAQNSVGSGVEGATIAGGGTALYPNQILASHATIGGGTSNTVTGFGLWATIGGGRENTVLGSHSTVSGGGLNSIQLSTDAATIGGGLFNIIRFGNTFATIGGGRFNAIESGNFSATIAGGEKNVISNNASFSFIGGGLLNSAAGENATVGGGLRNTIGSQAAGAIIGGGGDNTIQTNGEYATIPGGKLNSATNYAFAAGRRAKANRTGAFVWADSTDADFAATANNQFLVRAAGGVGIGTPNPQGSLHVYSDNNPTVVRVQSTGTPGFGRLEFVSNPQGDVNEWRPGYIQSTDNGGFAGGLAFFVNGAGAGNKFGSNEVMRVVNGRVGIGTNNPQSALHVLGEVRATSFNPPSDRNLKENFTPVSPRDVLDKIAAMPISRWNFKGDAATPHVGPMAQDFHAAFGLGTDDKHIATVDADGVALAAIQGLNQKVEEKEARIAELERRLEKLERLMNRENGGAR